jgi:hypothetical protein
MKSIIKIAGFAVWMAGMIFLVSCHKDDSKIAYGMSNIYMPQALNISGGVNNNYPVPSGTDSTTFNYYVDTINHKVNVILGVSCSGMQSTGGYSVSVITRPDTVSQMITTGVLDTSTILMPAAVYSLPTSVSVNAGNVSATFNLSLDIAQLKLYPGKKLALAVSLSNPTKYQLNPSISTTIVIVDVDAMVIGSVVNVTWKYIQNPGNPFIASSMDAGGRWGTLAGWTENDAAKSHNGYGGFASDDGGTMDLEWGVSWGEPGDILNGKIYQTVTLPAGNYSFDLSGGNWSGGENFMKDIGYFIVAPNLDTLPDYNNITTTANIYYQQFVTTTQPVINFKLSATTKITLGTVVSYFQDQQGFKTKQVILYSYPKHL